MYGRFIFLCAIFISHYGFAYQPKVYDCFLFSNELEMLEIRLNELYPYVDKFVLVESIETHRKADLKPLYFEMHKERFSPFLDKIIHIKLYEHIKSDNGWVRENWQRNQIMRGLTECHPEDIIMISDVDEFIPGYCVRGLYRKLRKIPHIGFLQKMYRWFLNRSTGELWAGTGVVKYKDLERLTPQDVRNLVRNKHIFFLQAGWHFTSMGGYPKMVEKQCNIVEGYNNVIDQDRWRVEVDRHKLVPIDSSYPRFVQDNIDYLIDCGMID